jgi:hypothetical protein
MSGHGYFLSDEGLTRLEAEMAQRQGGRGLTRQQLADLIEDKGDPISLETIASMLDRKRSAYYRNIATLFRALEIEFGKKDIARAGDWRHHPSAATRVALMSSSNRGDIMNPVAAAAFQDFLRLQQEGKVVTIHSAEKNTLPTPFIYGEGQRTGIPSRVLDRVSLEVIRGSWRMPQKYQQLQEFIHRLHTEGELTDLVTTGCAWMLCGPSDAPTFDNQSGVVWQAIAAPPAEAIDYVAWGGADVGYRSWIRVGQPDGSFEVYVTDPTAQYLTKRMKLIEFNDRHYRYSEDVERVA